MFTPGAADDFISSEMLCSPSQTITLCAPLLPTQMEKQRRTTTGACDQRKTAVYFMKRTGHTAFLHKPEVEPPRASTFSWSKGPSCTVSIQVPEKFSDTY